MGNLNDVKYTDYRWLKKLNMKINNNLIENSNLESHSIYSPASMTEMLSIEKKYKYYLENKKLENSNEFFNENFDVFKTQENEYHKFKIPIENEIIYRRKRLSRNNLKLLKPHSMNTLSHLKLFYYESIFEGVEIDENDHFIEKFTHHYTIMHQALINALMKILKPYLEKNHNIKKEKFTFSKLRNILAKDFELNPYFNTTAFPLYYIRNLTKSNFTEIIIQIFSEKYVFRKVNEVITNKIVNENMMFYILCVYFIYDTEANHSELERTYKNMKQIDLDVYKSENMLVNFEFMSTTAEKKFINFMDNVIEIVYERILNKNWYLSMKSLDTELLSQYPTAKEVIIQPNTIFEVKTVEKLPNDKYYIKVFLRANTYVDITGYNMSIPMQLDLGICLEIGSNIFEMYPDIDLDKIASLTITTKESLKSNKDNIAKMRNLRVLDMKGIKLTDEDFLSIIPMLKNLKYLDYLNVSINNLEYKSMAGLADIMDDLKFLEYLNFNQNNLDDKGALELVRGIPKLKNLRSLGLFYNQIKSAAFERISQELDIFDNMKFINFSTNYIYQDEMDNLIYTVSNMKHLVYLNLSGNQMSNEGLLYLAQKLPKSLQRLNISENEITQSGYIEFSNCLDRIPNLIYLNVYGNKMGFEGFKLLINNLSKCPKLTTFNIGCNFLNDEYIKIFTNNIKNFPQLKHLNLCENNITNDGMDIFMSKIDLVQTFKTLDLSWNSINGECIKNSIKTFMKIPEFFSLKMDNNPFDEKVDIENILNVLHEYDKTWEFKNGEFIRKKHYVPKSIFAEKYIIQNNTTNNELLRFVNQKEKNIINEINNFKNNEHVKELVLAKTKLSVETVKLFAENLKYLNRITKLDLRGIEMTNEGLISISKNLKELPNIEKFILRENNIGDEGLKSLAANLKYIKKLKILNLNWNLISDEGIIALSLIKLPYLEHLSLNENKITFKGMESLSLNLKNFVNLKKFDIGWNFVGKEGIKLFSEKMEILKDLTNIILSRTEMGDEGFIKFSENMNKLKKLEVLYFWNNDITNYGGKVFYEKLNEMNDVKFVDLSVNKMSENVKQDIRDLCDIKHISYDI